MIRLDDLYKAVSAVSARDPEIGYGLRELLDSGRISASDREGDGEIYFVFDGEYVPVHRVTLFNHGTEPLEERLVLKYGELVERHNLRTRMSPIDYLSAEKKIRQAGLDRLVDFEIKVAMGELKRLLMTSSGRRKACEFYESRLELLTRLTPGTEENYDIADGKALYFAEISHDLVTNFIHYPFSYNSLRQTAEINLDFFHLRFILHLFITGSSDHLYASTANGKLTGLLLINEKQRLTGSRIEIKYISTVNSVPLSHETVKYPRVRGTGTFLIAGTWFLWKEKLPKALEISLSAESGAADFYKSTGFTYRHPYQYSLKNPAGKLLLYIVVMAMNLQSMTGRLEKAIHKCIIRQFRYLKKRTDANDPNRKAAVLIISSCIQSGENHKLREMAKDLLERYIRVIPEAGIMLEGMASGENSSTPHRILKGSVRVPVIWDSMFENHLKGIFHMESPKRIRTVSKILSEEPFPDQISLITPRAATVEELAWVHDHAYIAKVAQTSGVEISSLDPDTQTTAQSYGTARLAAGAVFSLIDAIYRGKTGSWGMAFIRPPGHHAEPDRAMGFCLFNNVSLGAVYAMNHYDANKILIVDIDLHHGNGTQKIFYNRDDVLYFSIHQFPCFPGTGKLSETGDGPGKGYTVNIPLSMGHGDPDYQKIFHFMLSPVARKYKPDLILVSLGFDLYHEDPLGRMNVTPEGYAIMTYMLKGLAQEICDGRIIFIMEGGYSIKGIKKCGLRVMQELAGIPTVPPHKIERVKNENPFSMAGLKKAIDVHREYWPCLP